MHGSRRSQSVSRRPRGTDLVPGISEVLRWTCSPIALQLLQRHYRFRIRRSVHDAMGCMRIAALPGSRASTDIARSDCPVPHVGQRCRVPPANVPSDAVHQFRSRADSPPRGVTHKSIRWRAALSRSSSARRAVYWVVHQQDTPPQPCSTIARTASYRALAVRLWGETTAASAVATDRSATHCSRRCGRSPARDRFLRTPARRPITRRHRDPRTNDQAPLDMSKPMRDPTMSVTWPAFG